jgi:peptidoglycan hydrolase-like protein with peptidoglycan-binding domain
VLSANTTAVSVTTPRQTTGGTTFTEPLFIGSRSSQVLALQQFLIGKGYLASDGATGLYGPLTEAAVKKYQCAKNIVCGGTGASTGYGLVGTATRAALNQETASTTTAPGGMTAEQKQALIQSLLLQVQVLMEKLKVMRGY